jgi:hypothetical protein
VKRRHRLLIATAVVLVVALARPRGVRARRRV